ncbi:unnamed protein product [Penicillium olsonii]|nr:unnamed protein product [Penicillium olsonii]CAG7928853.1 unnamed protein product [Penicillium olsonii]
MPPKKGTRKRKADPPKEPEPSEVSSVASDPPPKKPKGLGFRAESIPPLSLENLEGSTVKNKQPPGLESDDDTEIEDVEQITRTRVTEGPGPVNPDQFANYVSYNMLYHSAGIAPAMQKRQRPPRQQRWKNPNKEPITKASDTPDGWNPNEPDLDPDDVDAQIDRCFERIDDNIMPNFFEIRLEQYLRMRKARKEIADSQPKGLDLEVVQRLHHLSAIQNQLQTRGDPDDQLPNVRALLKAYRGGDLKVSRGMVTYWSEGVQLNKPEMFNRELHEKMIRENDATRSFWVEGILQQTPQHLGHIAAYLCYNNARAVQIPIKVTTSTDYLFPHQVQSVDFEALHDTGADMMAIPAPKFEQIEAMGTKAVLYGYSVMEVVGGTLFYSKIVELEVSPVIPLTDELTLSPWLKVPAAVIEDQSGGNSNQRVLSGPFPRFQFYTATCPDGLGLFYMSWFKEELTEYLPALPLGYQTDMPPIGYVLPPSPGGGPPRAPVKQAWQGTDTQLPQVSTKQPVKRVKRARGRGRGRGRGIARGRA